MSETPTALDNDGLQATVFRAGAATPALVPLVEYGSDLRYLRRAASRIAADLVFEGDIRLDPPKSDAKRDNGGRGLGSTGLTWAGGVIPYQIAGADAELVAGAIRHWEAMTPIRFRPYAGEDDFVSFENQFACWSYVGPIGGYQPLSLSSDCTVGSAIHEIGHLVGLWHEQSRSDRDEHVTVLEANIEPDQRHNFRQHQTEAALIGGYDYASIIHYPTLAFSRNGQPTIVPKNGEPIGQRIGLSVGDIAAVRTLYRNLEWTSADNTHA